MIRGIRARLAVTLVALVALTAVLLGAGAYLFVENGLRSQVVSDAAAQARFDLAVIIPDRDLPAAPTPEDVVDSGLRETFRERGVETIVDLGAAGVVISNNDLDGAIDDLPADLRTRVDRGELAYAWTTVAGEPSLVVGGRLGGTGPAFYFIHDVRALEDALAQLRLALITGTLILIALALLVARIVARGVLAPVEAASRAAERIEQGDLSARVPVSSNDEFGTWAERFNRMAAALAETIGRLEAAETHNRRFVADVSHELRTPVAALVAEASILRDHVADLPSESRRAGELLVADVGRLRTLVDDLMEISRFDAGAEQVTWQSVDLVALARSVVAARLPEATVRVLDAPLIVESDPRRLERILGNLLDNAREHAPGATVEVVLEATDDEIRLLVADRGPGIPADRLPTIFDRFSKGDPSRHGGSSGLGLASAAEHAALLGGDLSAANRPGGGLQVELRIPVTRSLPAGDVAAIDRVDA